MLAIDNIRETHQHEQYRAVRDSLPPDGRIALVIALGDMVSRAGLEPATTALKVRCSTN